MRRGAFAVTALLMGTLLDASIVQAKHIAFIGCPIMRDMQARSLPCWLARDGDKLYYLGLQSDTIPPVPFYPPQLLHKVLVEAEIADGPSVCGGIATTAVRASVMPELSPECDEILPQGEVVAPPAVKASAPFRQGMRLAILPPGTSKRQYAFPTPPRPQPPFQAKTFAIDFFFGEDFIYLDDGFAIAQAVGYFNAIKGSRITMEIPRDKVKLSSGATIEEDVGVVRRRTERIRGILQEWGVSGDKIVAVEPKRASSGQRLLKLIVSP